MPCGVVVFMCSLWFEVVVFRCAMWGEGGDMSCWVV